MLGSENGRNCIRYEIENKEEKHELKTKLSSLLIIASVYFENFVNELRVTES